MNTTRERGPAGCTRTFGKDDYRFRIKGYSWRTEVELEDVLVDDLMMKQVSAGATPTSGGSVTGPKASVVQSSPSHASV